MYDVNLILEDTNGNEVKRTIDITNLLGDDQRLASEFRQVELINEWIEDRGNEQHATTLTYISHTIS